MILGIMLEDLGRERGRYVGGDINQVREREKIWRDLAIIAP